MIRKEFLCVNSGGFLKNSISRFFAKTQNARRPKARKDLQSQIQLMYTLIPKSDLSTTDRRSGVSPADKPILLESESNDYLQQLAQQSNPFSTSTGTSNAPMIGALSQKLYKATYLGHSL